MICRMFEIGKTIDLKIAEFPNICDPNCKYFKNNKCDAVHDTNTKLTKMKFSWMIEKIMNLGEMVPSKSGKVIYHSGLVLIHPSEPTITILRCWKSDYVLLYIVCSDKTKIHVDTLEEMNEQLKKFNYDGREITVEDFHDIDFREIE